MLQRELIILQYHHVGIPGPEVKYRNLYVSPKHFEWQLQRLKRSYCHVITFYDLLTYQYTVSTYYAKPLVILTFDDGTAGVYDYAFPLLKKYDFPAVVFPVVGDLGKRNVVWKDNTDKHPLDILTPENIQEMSQHGVEFGSHLYHHVRASLLPQDQLIYELNKSKSVLESLVSKEILSIAYPFGYYNEQVIHYAKQAGYRFGVTTQHGTNQDCSLLELNRIPVKGTRLHHFLSFLKLTFSFAHIQYKLKETTTKDLSIHKGRAYHETHL